jgi:SPP1 family phage portal protein
MEEIKSILEHWDNKRYNKLNDYYLGKHDILNRTLDCDKPNNKLMHNFPSYIVDVNKGYFIGNPVAYSGDEFLLPVIQDIFTYNDEQDENSELANDMGVFGKAYEIVYLDEQPQIRFNNIDPRDIRVVYSNEIVPEIVMAIRRYKVGDDYQVEVYDSETIKTYLYKEQKLQLLEERDQVFGMVPVIEYKNNTEEKGDFEDVISLVDAYNLSRSDKTNDLEYFTDAILMLEGFSGADPEEIKQLKQDRVLKLDNGGGAEWLIKPNNTEDHKMQIEMLINDIHKFSKTVDLSDERFAQNASGIAIAYKLFIMMQNISNKERKFKKGLQRRIEIICNYLNFRANSNRYDWRSIDIKFDRNEPIDDKQSIEVALGLKALGVSTQTWLSYLPTNIIPNVTEELDRMEQEDDPYAGAVDGE